MDVKKIRATLAALWWDEKGDWSESQLVRVWMLLTSRMDGDAVSYYGK